MKYGLGQLALCCLLFCSLAQVLAVYQVSDLPAFIAAAYRITILASAKTRTKALSSCTSSSEGSAMTVVLQEAPPNFVPPAVAEAGSSFTSSSFSEPAASKRRRRKCQTGGPPEPPGKAGPIKFEVRWIYDHQDLKQLGASSAKGSPLGANEYAESDEVCAACSATGAMLSLEPGSPLLLSEPQNRSRATTNAFD